MEQKLVVFTSLFSSQMGGIKDLLVLLGKEKEARKIDKEYQARKALGPWGLEELTELYGGFSQEKLRETTFDYCQRKIIKGMKGFLFELKDKGFIIGVLSSDPKFMLDISKEILPLDFVDGCHLEFQDNIATGKLKKKIDRYGKAEIVKEKEKKYSIGKQNTIAMGRATIVNLPVAKQTRFFVGFDVAKETVDDLVAAVRDNKNLARFLCLKNKIF